MINQEQYFKLAEELINTGKKNGATEIQISISKSDDFSIEVKDGEIERLSQAGPVGIGIKVIVDKRTATASSSDMKKETLENLVKNAVTRAKLASTDEFAGLPDNEKINSDISALKLYDLKIEEVSSDLMIQRALDLEKMAMADKRATISGGSFFGKSTSEIYLINSNGFSNSFKTSSCSTGVSLMSGENANSYEDGYYDHTIHYEDLMSNELIAAEAIRRLTRMLGAKKIKTQKVPIIFEQGISGSILGFLSSCLGGNSIYMKRSFLAGKLGEKIAPDFVNITDDGFIPKSPRSRPFDGEGVPTLKKSVVENGILTSYLLDTYSARKLKMKSTGNASGTTNFTIGGNTSAKDIIKSVKEGLYLIKTIGQGTVPTSGDYSKGAYGLWIENGELTYPVSEITISGNLGSMLKDIELVGNDVDFIHGKMVPTIKIKEMTISGL
ncbi:MAG: TldD/PmbA family protein [Candidatus Kapabacteria bacterium]|nr:TldD/PmbA family protein [Candidatus Kapabacteria bacterium]